MLETRYYCRDCSAREISPGQECLCSRAKQGWMEEEIEACEEADEWMGTEKGRCGERAGDKWKCKQHNCQKTDKIKFSWVHSCAMGIPV